jgi:nitrogenase molybdenum-iron protein alpha chain
MDTGIQYRAMARDYYICGRYTAPLVCSALKEEHSIFGGSEQLRRCIDHVVAKYRPRYVVIANSCVAGVIGDDTDAVAQQAEADWQLPILSVPCHSFLDGDFHAGFYYTAKGLADRFMTPLARGKAHQADLITLLGDRGGPGSRDVVEMNRLVRYFGFKTVSLFPAYASIEEMARVPASTLSVLMGGTPQALPWAKKLALDFQTDFGTIWLDQDYPICWTRTRSWLESMGVLLDRQTAARLAIKEQTVELNEHLAVLLPQLRDKKIIFCIGRSRLLFDPSWVFELIELSGVRLMAVVLLEDSLTGPQQEELRRQLPCQTTAPILISSEVGEILDSVDFVISTHELTNTAKRQLFLPMLPLVGVRGLVSLLKLMARLARRQGNRGGIIYG